MKNDDDDKITTPDLHRKKKPPSLMKKLKLRTRKSSIVEDLPRTSSSEERRTPEGDDDHLNSASETNLTEVSWKSADNLTEESTVKSVISTEVVERTKSLENLKAMPPFGELIVDEQEAMTVKYFSRGV